MDEICYQKFLTTRICDLNLDIDYVMAHPFQRLKTELSEHRIRLWPDFYFGNEWGCVNKKISISIPFHLATPELKKFEEDIPTSEELVKILRHETGHAINYAYKLWQYRDWKIMFGDFNKKYRDKYLYRVNPWSKSYVRHLHFLGDPHYAQKHPDEDWAETFAIWLDPRSKWEIRYRNWPVALEKLYFVDGLMKKLAGKKPLNLETEQDGLYTSLEETVSEWWGLDDDIFNPEVQEYIRDMNELFHKTGNGNGAYLPAWKLIHRYSMLLVEYVSLWISGSNKHTVRKKLLQCQAICKAENLLYFPSEEEQKLIELTTLLSCYVVDGVHNFRKHSKRDMNGR
ncbi:MAG: putative zinc-binding metallopeptidase [Candidatus Aureabacteria bacterium]|nr:putative zinc-binding metallopeptidase [Candidatus Auribacterota bacterium]